MPPQPLYVVHNVFKVNYTRKEFTDPDAALIHRLYLQGETTIQTIYPTITATFTTDEWSLIKDALLNSLEDVGSLYEAMTEDDTGSIPVCVRPRV